MATSILRGSEVDSAKRPVDSSGASDPYMFRPSGTDKVGRKRALAKQAGRVMESILVPDASRQTACMPRKGRGGGGICRLWSTGADLGQGFDPKVPPLYRPQNGCTEQWVLWVPEAPEILFRHTAGGNFFVRPYVSVLKILRILWRIQKWLKSTTKDFDPDPASGLDLG